MDDLRALTFQVLGELEVRRGDALVTLPQSKKTRALLAYLVLTNREHRRDRLCDLFWDVADDRRGALRWSLSKLRSVVDEEGAERIVADRERVSFAARGAKVDALELRRALASRPIARLETSELEAWARTFRGELLEGLDLADFDDYQTWCVGERERARELRTSILEELVRRLESDPARAVEHARVLVSIDPLREPARVALVKLLVALGRRDEARQHFEAARRLENELGRPPAPALLAALRDIDAGPRVPAADPVAEAGTEAASEATLVGRKRELRVLTTLGERVARDGRLGVVVVSGEPGVGKTRLLHEWMRVVRAGGDAALAGASFEAESGRPYGPWIEALADAPGLAREAMLQLSGAGSKGDVPNREDLFARVSVGVADLTRRGRVLAIVLDDVQWLDEGSAELLHYVARTNRERPLAIALAAREGELDDNSALNRVLRGLRREGLVEELSLGGLTREETHALLAELGVGDRAERVHEQSGGNPLFAIELARNVARGGGVASSLAGIVRDRIAQLPDDAAETARWAAVLGTSFGLEKLERVTSLDTEVIVRAIELLERRAILRRASHGELVFAHEIVRSIVYTDLSEPRRRLMHRRIAQMLAAGAEAGSGDLVADVAHHAALAGDAALAADACLGAARRSLRVFANADAFALARRGARHAERLDDPQRTKRLLELAEVTFAARPPEDADAEAKRLEALAERALDLACHDHARLGFHLVGFLRWERGVWGDAKKHMLQAELVSRGGSEAERVRGMAEAARCLVLLERDLPHAQALALEAAARGRQVGVEPAAIADALGMLALHRGRVTEAITQLERARSLSRAERDHYGEFQALEHLTMLHVERGDFRAAATRAEELTELGARFREGSEAPFARALAALTKIACGDHAAEEALERELEALTMADAKHRLGYVLARAALLDLRSDVLPPRDVVRTRSRAERALAIAEHLARPTEIAFARVALLRTARLGGDAALETEQRAALAALSPVEVAMSAKTLVAHELDDEAWLVSSNLGARS